jgi:hypothetical protein
MEPLRVYRSVVADFHHFVKEQDPDPAFHLNPDPHLSKMLDPDLR